MKSKVNKFLSIALMLCMMVSMLPISAFATIGGSNSGVAKIGDTEYATLSAAVEAAESGDAIIMTADDSTDQQITINKDIIIDLMGCDLSATRFKILDGTVVIRDSLGAGVINSTHADGIDATADESFGYGSRVQSAISIHGDAVVSLNNITVHYGGGELRKAIYLGGSGASLTINGGSYYGYDSSGGNAIYFYDDEGSELTVNDGYFYGAECISVNDGNDILAQLHLVKAHLVSVSAPFWIQCENKHITDAEDIKGFVDPNVSSIVYSDPSASKSYLDIYISSNVLALSPGFTEPENGSADGGNPAKITIEDGGSVVLKPQIIGGDRNGYNYVWKKGDDVISGANDSTYEVTEGGGYSVTVTCGEAEPVTLYWIVVDPNAPHTHDFSTGTCSCGVGVLSFSSENSFTLKTNNEQKNWAGTIEYSTDGISWINWDGTQISSSDSEPYVLYLRGEDNTNISNNDRNNKFVLDGTAISCTGNIENLLNYTEVASGNHPAMAEKAFGCLFYENGNLIAAPELSAITLTGYCYNSMFSGTGLTKAPKLPATTLAENCYRAMFQECTSLTEAPALSATTMKANCYYAMFNGCTGLTKAPALNATTLASNCYAFMFQDCTGLTEAPKLPATTLAEKCYIAMFQGCTGLTQTPELTATEMKAGCYQQMFADCTGLTTVPELTATTLAENCYVSMFRRCSGIKVSETETDRYIIPWSLPEANTPTDWNAYMLNNTGGTFTDSPVQGKTYYLYDYTAHIHSWSSTYSSDGTAHWHECTAGGCTVTNNSEKDGYQTHSAPADDNNCTTAVECASCKYVFTAAKPHSFTTEASTKQASAATCLDNRFMYAKCDNCDVVSDSVKVEAADTKLSHNYTYTLSANEKTITESCDKGCGHSESATISAPTGTLTYDGTTEFKANVTYSDEWAGGKDLVISYTRDGDITSAGEITASITKGGKTASVSYTVAKATPAAITEPTVAAVTYGTKLSDISIGSWVWTEGNTVPTVVNGGYTAYLTVDDNNYDYSKGVSGYADGKVTRTITVPVNKAQLTVTAKPRTITYGDAPANDGVIYSGFVNGENESVLDDTLGYEYSYTQYYNVGDYTITPNGLTADNYNITFADGTLTVTQKEIGIDWTQPANLEYDGGEKVPTAAATGLVNGDSVNITATLTSGNDNVNAGSFTYTATAINNDNYTLPSDVTSGSYTITKAPLTVTADNQTMTIGAALPTFTLSYSGFKGEDNAEAVFETLPTAATAADGKTAGNEFVITASGETSLANYDVAYVNGTLTVNTLALTFDANEGTGEMAEQTISNASTPINANTFTRDGYTFSGWNTLASGKGISYNDNAAFAPKGENVTLYAMWSESKKYAVKGNVRRKATPDFVNISGATVKLVNESGVVAETVTDENGNYIIANIPVGIYDIVVETDEQAKTVYVNITDSDRIVDVVLPEKEISSIVEVKPNTPQTVVGGLDDVAEAFDGELNEGDKVKVTLVVESKTEEQAESDAQLKTEIDTIKSVATQTRNVDYIDFSLVKEHTPALGTPTESNIEVASEVLEIIIPFTTASRRDFKVYRYHGSAVETFENLDTRPTGAFEDAKYFVGNGFIVIYAKKFSTYAIGYNVVSSSGGGGVSRYTVKFETNGGSTVASKTVSRNSVLVEPTAPTKEGFTFEGWYTDKALTEKYDFESRVTKSFTLYAKWTETEKEPDDTDTDNTGTLKWNPFIDVNETDWFYEIVKEAYLSDLINGTSENTFSPNGDITRGMFVTILWRAEGEIEDSQKATFEDVNPGAYYEKAVDWGAENGIILGFSETEYAPDKEITREQMAAILWRYAKYKNADVSADENTNVLSYTDAFDITEYAIPAMQWAVGEEIISGKGNGILDPLGNATRAEATAMLVRLLKR